MLPRCLSWIPVLLAASAATAGATEQCRFVQLPPIPVTVMDRRPTVPVEIDGHKTQLLVDTGAFFDALSPAEATEFNMPLRPGPYGLYVTGGFGNLYPQITTVKTLRVGPITFPGSARFLVLANDLGNGISGALGENLYRVLDVEFDFANGVMRLFSVTNCGQRSLAYWTKATGQSVSVLDLEPRNPAWPQLLATVKVNGHNINAIFDSGAPTSLLSRAAAKEIGVPPGSAGVTAVGTSGGLWRAPIDEIAIGDNEKIEHTHILVDGDDFAFGPGVWMFIGTDFFLSHRVYLATSQSKLYFTYNGGPVFDLNPAHAAQDKAPALPIPGATAGTPPDADALMRRGLALANQLEFQPALADLTQACHLAPRDADYRYQRGVVYWRDDRPELALEDFTGAIRLDPKDFRAWLWRAEVRLVMQAARKPDPTSATDPDIELSSVDRPASKDTGPSQSAATNAPAPGILDHSNADLDAVDRLAPTQADLRLTLGRVYEDIGRYARAVHQYDLWITYHPEDYRLPMAVTWRCGSRAQAGTNLDQALEDCNRASALMGFSWWSAETRWPPTWRAPLLRTRSLIELRQGDLKRAVADDNAAIKLDSSDAYAFYTRGLAELRQGSKTQGQSDLAAAQKLQPGIDQRYENMGLTP